MKRLVAPANNQLRPLARARRRGTGVAPLEGLTVRDNLITITLGGDISHHRRIVIEAAHVSVQQTGGVEGVAIESTDGHTTRLRFRSPMPTELVDGIGP